MDHFPILSSTQKPWPDFPALTLEDYEATQQPLIVPPKDDTKYRFSKKDFDDFPFFWLEDESLHFEPYDWSYYLIEPSKSILCHGKGFIANRYFR